MAVQGSGKIDPVSWNNAHEPYFAREQEAKERAQQRLDESAHQDVLETVGEGRISRRRIFVIAAAVVLALLVVNIAVRL
jgi:hypothetical protein